MTKQTSNKPGKGKGAGVDRKALKGIHDSMVNATLSKEVGDYILEKLDWTDYYKANYKRY